MSPRFPFDDRLTDWLDEGPLSAPREDLAVVLQEFPEIRERHPVGPWRLTMPTLTRLAMAAVIVLAIGAVAIAQARPGNESTVGTQPTPTPGWDQRFPTRTAAQFIEPFTYALDPSARIEVSEDTAEYQFRVPGATPAAVVTHIAELRLDPCRQTGGAVDTKPTAQSFAAYMSTIPGLSVTTLPPTTIDGRPALGVDVMRQSDASCSDVWLFSSESSFTCCWPDDPTWVRRMWAIDVDGRLVVITTPFGAATKDAQLATANALVDSIHFRAAPAGSAIPSN
jgi:hypothetical protein